MVNTEVLPNDPPPLVVQVPLVVPPVMLPAKLIGEPLTQTL